MVSNRGPLPRPARRAAALVAAALAASLGAACQEQSPSTGAGGRLSVVAAVYPLGEAARRVGGDLVSVTELTPAGAEPHDLELTTRQVDRLEDADLVVYLGRGFQPAVEEVAGRTGNEVLDVLEGADVLAGEDDHGDEGEGDDDHEGEDDHGDEAVDPHLWLDPTRMAGIVERVRDALIDADADGDHADRYRRGADAYLGELAQLDADFRAGLAQCQRRTIVTTHAAFGYLARRYDLRQLPIAGLSPESEPDPRRVAQLVDRVRAEGHTTVFTETLVSPAVAETLAREAGVGTAVLDPLEGLSSDQRAAGGTYLSIMRENLEALRSALGCQG
ncbi:MAG TPA: metal ABC transporter substrate-binding protein [Acidimicrobiales bacterium]|nr:metal ABC transporter substrate-binding protein [Acidimicrobiales bacterium]